MDEAAVLNRVVQGSLTEKVSFEQRPEGNERAALCLGEGCRPEDNCAKASRQEEAGCLGSSKWARVAGAQ